MKANIFLFFGIILTHFSCITEGTSNQSSNSYSSINSKNYAIEVDINTTDSSYFEKDIYIDLSETEFFVDNFVGLLKYRIDFIQFNIENYEGDNLIQCDFELEFVQLNTTVGNSITYTIPLDVYSQQGTFINVNHSPSTLTAVEESMNFLKEATLRVKGTVSGKPVKFDSTFLVRIQISSN